MWTLHEAVTGVAQHICLVSVYKMSYGANSLKGLMKPKGHGEIKNRVREREPYRMQEQQRQRDTAVGL